MTTLIIFSIIITMSIACIGLYYSNSNIFNLEYKEANIKEIGYGSIDIVHSNILTEVEFILQNTSNKDEFNNYFLGNNFLNNIKDISKSELNGALVNIPTKIKIDNINGILEFNIVSTVRDSIYRKRFQASVKIKNPFLSQIVSVENDNEIEIREFNINEIVTVYDYKEI